MVKKKDAIPVVDDAKAKKLAAIQKACAALQAKFGKESVNFLGNNKAQPLPRIPTGSVALDRITGGGYPLGRIIEIFGPAASGKCLTKDTMVLTTEGYRSIEDIFLMNNITPFCTQKEISCSYPLINMNGEAENTTHFVMNGKRNVFQVKTTNGTIIKSTAKHPLRVITENGYIIWKRTQDLNSGDILVGRIGENYFPICSNEEKDTVEGLLIGFIIADSYTGDKRISFSNSNKEIIDFYENNYSKIPEFENLKLNKYKAEGRITTELHLNSKEKIQEFYNRINYKEGLAKDKVVPEYILYGNRILQSSFLRGYFDCESSIEPNGINVTSASYTLLYQIKNMLSNFGIISSLKSKKVNNYPENDYWVLSIYGINIERFNKNIGWFTSDRKEKYKDTYDNKDFYDDYIPHIRKLLEEYYNSIDPSLRTSELYDLFALSKKRENNWYSKNRLKDVLELTSSYANQWLTGALSELMDEHLSFEIVESVNSIGEIETFDFAMEKTHSFIAQGIINHNTSLCYHAIAEAQRTYPDKWCGFVDSEHTFDPDYAANIGVNVDELVTAQPDSGTDAFAMVQGLIESGASLIVVDSVAAMVPREEMEEEDYGKNSIGLQARMMSKGLRKLTAIAGKNKCVIIFTNQTRNKIGVMYGCFDGRARVVLSDGTTKPIKWIVKNRYNGEVKSVNQETGLIENKKIINWFDNGGAKNWYRVKVQKGIKQGIAKFVVGDDHTFITPIGEIKLSDLKINDKVYVKGYNYLSDTDMSLIIGGLLGDGSIKYRRTLKNKEKSNKCSFRVVHGLKQTEYCKWKMLKMSPDFFRENSFSVNNRYVCFQSKMTQEIEWLIKYKEKSAIRFIDDKLLSKIDLISLAIWYLDDGTYSGSHARWGKGKSVIYCTKMDVDSKKKIVQKIFELTGAEFSIFDRGFSASGDNSWKFQNAIAPYVPKCMSYKMHQDLFNKLDTFDGWNKKSVVQCWNIGRILQITNIKNSKRSFGHKYDIQIEDNANYFVDDVLVHNSPQVTTGGKSLEYYASIRLRISQIGKVEETVNGEKVVKAIESKITTVKNKVFAPYKNCTAIIEFGKGIDNDASILNMAIEYGLIVKKGGWYSIDGTNVAQGMVNLRDYLEKNEEVYNDIKNKIKEMSKKEASKEEVDEKIEAEEMTDEEIADKVSNDDDTETGEV